MGSAQQRESSGSLDSLEAASPDGGGELSISTSSHSSMENVETGGCELESGSAGGLAGSDERARMRLRMRRLAQKRRRSAVALVSSNCARLVLSAPSQSRKGSEGKKIESHRTHSLLAIEARFCGRELGRRHCSKPLFTNLKQLFLESSSGIVTLRAVFLFFSCLSPIGFHIRQLRLAPAHQSKFRGCEMLADKVSNDESGAFTAYVHGFPVFFSLVEWMRHSFCCVTQYSCLSRGRYFFLGFWVVAILLGGIFGPSFLTACHTIFTPPIDAPSMKSLDGMPLFCLAVAGVTVLLQSSVRILEVKLPTDKTPHSSFSRLTVSLCFAIGARAC